MIAYQNAYMDAIKEILPIVADQRALKSYIREQDIDKAESQLRFSLVFNDLSLLNWVGSNKLGMIWLQSDWFDRQFGVKDTKITTTREKLAELGIDPEGTNIVPAFVFPGGERADAMASELSPFVESGRLLIQPDRNLFYLKEELTEDGSRQWHGINASPFSPLDNWEIVDEKASRPIPIKSNQPLVRDEKQLFDVTIPYLEGVSFGDLAKILEDEGDLISGLRASIKQAISEYGNETDAHSLVNDLVDPKVDAINRKFKLLVNSHAFRVAGACVGTVVLGYTAVATSGISSAIATICGSGGVGLLGREYSSYREKVNVLKEDPYYFLWRCKQLSKRT
ncbi:MAG: hypothetical protein KUF77_00335 [Candidatus Thiodiazotropha sp. (ex Lucina aurantia)]|nr:hypothetical protein [Candidatus Thiodiazotropha taylori]MBV2099727.1 hypothetical protein [Candidatus Thiodiazotropha sp. (ex Codakia orbicularis)]MBV2101453.1 hypothetical protein [Candidatus Thiodiazotropha sp. (ex Lucina aurantia)]MBV2115858.1 hypothetical protein [Candidatus Thiodiazotropha sp. (ex Lucina aurantia)]